MFCKNCGEKNPDASKFCTKCGSALTENTDSQTNDTSKPQIPEQPQITDLPEMNATGGVHCPKCKSTKLQALMETDVQGGYRAGRGCLGYLLFGPLGFLCGACGKKSKIQATNNSLFVCMECGFKFIELEEMMALKENETKYNLIGCIAAAVGSIALISVLGLYSLVGLLIAFGAFLSYREAKKDCDELREKQYDAPCFLKWKKE